MTGRVFISHSSGDKPKARAIALELRNKGIDVWIDEDNIDVGSSIPTAIFDGIDSSDYFVILVSGKSVQSRWVHREAEIAFQKSIEGKFPIIPIILDNTPLPRSLKDLKHIDLRMNNKAGLDELISFLKKDDRLASDLRRVQPPLASKSNAGDDCVQCLKSLTAKNLREKILQRYNYNEIGVIWFDLFETRIGDELPGVPLSNAVIELIDKAKKKQKFDELLSRICEQNPDICP